MQSINIPGRPFRGPDAPQKAFRHLERFCGLEPKVASNRLHKIKARAQLSATDDVIIGRTGDVYNATTGEHLGSLTDKSLGTER
jgi:hypothetical protein